MIGKLLRLAFMEKDARRKWEAAQAAKADRSQARKAGRVAPKAGRADGPEASGPIAAQAPAQTRAPAPASGAEDDPAETVRAAIAAAEREMLDDVGPAPSRATGPSSPPRAEAGRAATPANSTGEDRARLIQSALTVHKLKQSALDDLDPKTRAQLRVMAERMLGVDKSG